MLFFLSIADASTRCMLSEDEFAKYWPV